MKAANKNSDSPIYPERKFKTAFEWHIYHVYNDPDFEQACLKINPLELDEYPINPKTAKKLGDISKEFSIHEIYIREYIRGFPNGLIKMQTDFSPLYELSIVNEDIWQFIDVRLYPHVTQKEFIALWDKILEAKKALGEPLKYKPPQNHALIYSVFKARRTKSFKEIYSLYESGKLQGYKGSNSQYPDQESLERYYNKYRPDLKYNHNI